MRKIDEFEGVHVEDPENRYPYHIEIDGEKFEVGSDVFGYYVKSIDNIGGAGVTVVLGRTNKVEDTKFLQISTPKVFTLEGFVRFVRRRNKS